MGSAALKPFRFPAMWVVLALMILACASDEGGGGGGGPQVYNYASLSRSDGLAYGHFTSRVSIHCSYIDSYNTLYITGLPTGLAYNSSNQCIEGDDPGPGQWMITVHWGGIHRETGVQTEWKQDFELRFFTKLEENR